MIKGLIQGCNAFARTLRLPRTACRGQSVPAPNSMVEKKDVQITHKAMIDKILEREITHFTTRKFSRDQAVSLLIRGFMNVGILRLPDAMNVEING